MRLQEIYINKKYDHVVNYETVGDCEESFVIETPVANDSIDLLTFPMSNNNISIESQNGPKGVRCSNITVDKIDKDGNVLHVSLEFEEINIPIIQDHNRIRGVKQNIVPQNADDQFVYDDDDMNLSWRVDGSNMNLLLTKQGLPNSALEIHFKLKIAARNNSQKFIVYIAPQNKIADVVLDFGSESTQLAVYPRGEEMTINAIVNLFDSIKQSKEGNLACDKDYYQFDESDNNLYRSNFFVKKEISKDQIKDSFIPKPLDNPILKVFTTMQEIQDCKDNFMVLPNIKLSGYGGLTLPQVEITTNQHHRNFQSPHQVGDKYFYRATISLFVNQALEVVKQKCINYVSLHILMPNVYRQKDIVSILKCLYIDIKNILKDKDNESIKGFDVTAVSESDASIIGVCEYLHSLHVPGTPNYGNYLILDAGKGTLDFSLLKYGFDNNHMYTYKNIWRSGIIGAGNSITYAYFLALLHQYLDLKYCGDLNECDKLKNFIYYNILGNLNNRDEIILTSGDTAYLLNMMMAVDNYKIHVSDPSIEAKDQNSYKSDGHNLGKKTANLDEIHLDTFVSWLQGCVNVARNSRLELTHPEYVENMINELVNETITKIKVMLTGRKEKIDYVIFSGRAFKEIQFKEKMKESLFEIDNEMQEIEFLRNNQAVSMKNICLLGATALRLGEYNRKIMSEPILLKPKANNINHVRKDDNMISAIVKWVTGLFTNLRDRILNTKKDPSVDCVQKERENVSFNEFFDRYLSSESQFEGNKFPLKGLQWDVSANGVDRVNLGGEILSIIGVAGQTKVFFDGEDYIWCSNNNCGRFTNPINMATSEFFYSSFFPNFKVQHKNDIKVSLGNGNDNVVNVNADNNNLNSGEIEPSESSEYDDFGKLVKE